MRRDIPDFLVRSEADQQRLGEEGVRRLLDAGRAWDLAPILRAGGAVIFPHTSIAACGHQVAAAVHACLDSGAKRVLALGVLHALTQELEEARVQVANGADPSGKPAWGIQGPGVPGREDWRAEFSLSHFQFLWRQETARRGIPGPELVIRYPSLAGGRPDLLPGIDALQEIAQDAVVVATMDPFHHGIGYGDLPEQALAPEEGGLELARQAIQEGLTLLQTGEYWRYNQHSVRTKSDGRDVGQTLRYLLGSQRGEILDLIGDDMSIAYDKPKPTWVAGALIALQRS
jgi:hypothetical protein